MYYLPLQPVCKHASTIQQKDNKQVIKIMQIIIIILTCIYRL